MPVISGVAKTVETTVFDDANLDANRVDKIYFINYYKDMAKNAEKRFDELVEAHGDPLEELFRIGMDLDVDASTRRLALDNACSYGMPKLKATEQTITADINVTMKEVDLTTLSDKELNQLLALVQKVQNPA